ncbi:MAG: PGPGW domain-containing protein, partial [Nitrospiraceae bacterium]
LFVLSVVGFVASLIVIPFVLVRLPPQYFDVRYPRTWMKEHHPVLRWVGLILKNVVGVVFFLAGVAMLFFPGQGLLTMLIGLSMVDFPGKRRLESKLMGQPKVLKTINALRHKFGQPPLTVASDK